MRGTTRQLLIPIAAAATLGLGGCGLGGAVSDLKAALKNADESTELAGTLTNDTTNTSGGTTDSTSTGDGTSNNNTGTGDGSSSATDNTGDTTDTSGGTADNSGGTTDTSGGTTQTAVINDGLFVQANAATGAITARSPNNGSTVAVTVGDTWTKVDLNAPSTPDWIKEEVAWAQANDPNYNAATFAIYRRPVNVSVSGGVPTTSTGNAASPSYEYQLTTWNQDLCGGARPASCAAPEPYWGVDGSKATQNGVAVTENNVQTGANSPLVVFKGGEAEMRSDGSQYVRVGEYSSTDLSFRLLALEEVQETDGNGNVVGTYFRPIIQAGSATGTRTVGAYLEGENTPVGDMDALKSSNVTATYNGWFNGKTMPTSAVASIDDSDSTWIGGGMAMNANFGSGKVSGSAPNLSAWASNGEVDLPYGVVINGDISGSRYQGTAQYSLRGSSNPLSGATSGQMVGGFYGPQAAETGAIVSIQGATPGAAQPGPGVGPDQTMIGTFVGQRQTNN